MIILDEYKVKITNLKKDIEELGKDLGIESLRARLSEIEKISSENGFWDDIENSQKILSEQKQIKTKTDKYDKLLSDADDALAMVELAIEEGDDSFDDDIVSLTSKIEKGISEQKIETLLDGEYDKNNAILSINAGTGGLDAQDCAQILLRMYTRWANNKGYKVKTLDYLPDTEAGIKSVTLSIEGLNAYGYLKSEKGVHRIVRISPYDTSGKRHTSFVSVDITPELDDDIDVQINPSDLKIDTYRASGAGGQHVNTTDSAVRITHIPTGVTVQCQNERSQHKNKDTAMKMLMAKLIELKELEQKEKIEDIQGKYSQITWGSQIRSYVFQPYKLVKDHRTNAEIGNVDSVMDGNLDLFINEYLKMNKSKNS